MNNDSNDQPSDLALYSFLSFSLAGVCVLLAYALYLMEAYVCASRWEKSGMRTDYGLVQGCLIEHEGRWVPEQNYREIP